MVKKRASGAADRYKKLLDKVKSMDLGGGTFWKPSEGRSTIRILPPVGTMEFFFKEVGRHYVGGTSYYCPRICSDGKETCPLCELNQALYDSGEKDAASDWRASRAFFMNIIVRGEESAGPKVFTPGITIFGSIVALAQDPDYGEIYDIDEGTDISIDRKGTGLETEYNVTPKRDVSVLGNAEEVEDWLENAMDVDAHITSQLLPYDELAEKSGAAVYLFEDDGESEDPEEDWEEDEESEDDEESSPSELVKQRLQKRRGRRSGRPRR